MPSRTITDVMGDMQTLISDDNKEKFDKLKLELATNVKAIDDSVNAKENENKKLQADKDEIVKKRDEIKSDFKDFSSKLGVDVEQDDWRSATDKAIAEKVTESEKIALLNRDKENLQKEIEESKSKHDQELSAVRSDNLKLSISKEAVQSLSEFKAKPQAAEYIMGELSKNAKVEDGVVKFSNADGTTMRIDGRDATVKDYISAMREKEVAAKKDMFFDIGPQKSGTATDEGSPDEGEDFKPGDPKNFQPGDV